MCSAAYWLGAQATTVIATPSADVGSVGVFLMHVEQSGANAQTGLTVTVYNVTQSNSGPSFDPSTANWLDQLQVTVSLPLSNVQLTGLHFLSTDPGTVLTAKAVWFSNQDQDYPTTITPPSGS